MELASSQMEKASRALRNFREELGLPIDTDSDPDFAAIPIPGNDDAIRSIETVLKHLGEAVEQGKRSRPAKPAKDESAGEPSPRKRSRRAMARADGGDAAPKAGRGRLVGLRRGLLGADLAGLPLPLTKKSQASLSSLRCQVTVRPALIALRVAVRARVLKASARMCCVC